jgi:hypothetical protein
MNADAEIDMANFYLLEIASCKKKKNLNSAGTPMVSGPDPHYGHLDIQLFFSLQFFVDILFLVLRPSLRNRHLAGS